MCQEKNSISKKIPRAFLPLILAVLCLGMLFSSQPAIAADQTEWTADELTSSENTADQNDTEDEDSSAAAAVAPGKFIFDVSGVSGEELAKLEAQAQELYENYGLGIYFGEEKDESDLGTIERAQAFYEQNCALKDGVLLYLCPGEYYVYLSGRAAHIFTEEETDQIWDVFVTDNKYYDEGISDYLSYMGERMEAHGLQVIPSERKVPLLVDAANLLTPGEEERLLAALQETSEKESMDVAVVTVLSTEGKTPEAYADDYYDYNGLGQGENKDGVLLLISMEERDWHVTTTGFGITAVNDAAIELIEDRMVSYLSNGQYYDGFRAYCNTVDEVAAMARNGNPYEKGFGGTGMSTKSAAMGSGLLAIILGFLIGFIVSGKQKQKLKSVRKQRGASAYIYGDASRLTISEDRFIRRNVVRTRIEKDDDRGGGGGGSTIHFGSSGTSHGGGGGKF